MTRFNRLFMLPFLLAFVLGIPCCQDENGIMEIPPRPITFLASDYLPIEVGMLWTYEYTKTESNTQTISDILRVKVLSRDDLDTGVYFQILLDYVNDTYVDRVVLLEIGNAGDYRICRTNARPCSHPVFPAIIQNGAMLLHNLFILPHSSTMSVKCVGHYPVTLPWGSEADGIELTSGDSSGGESIIYAKNSGLLVYRGFSYTDFIDFSTTWSLISMSLPDRHRATQNR